MLIAHTCKSHIQGEALFHGAATVDATFRAHHEHNRRLLDMTDMQYIAMRNGEGEHQDRTAAKAARVLPWVLGRLRRGNAGGARA